MNWKESLLEAFKEMLRVAVIAVVPLVITGLEAGYVDWRLVVGAACIAVLKALDKFVHKWDGTEQKGLLPF